MTVFCSLALWVAIGPNHGQCLRRGTRTGESHGVATGSPRSRFGGVTMLVSVTRAPPL